MDRQVLVSRVVSNYMELLNLLPSSSKSYLTDSTLVDSIVLCKFFLQNSSSCVTRSNLFNLRFSEFGKRMTFSGRRPRGRNPSSAFFGHVDVVVRDSSQKEMRGINTFPVVTGVTNQQTTFNSSEMQLPRDSVCFDIFSSGTSARSFAFFRSVKREYSITGSTKLPSPLPAPLRFLNLIPKSIHRRIIALFRR